MQTEIHSKNSLHKFGTYLFNFGLMTGLAVLTLGLISCGGGDIGITIFTGNATPTITSITPPGIVASSAPRTLSILGTNFVNGMTLSITSSSGIPYTITSSSVTSSTVLTANVIIPVAPADNYVTFAIKASGGTTQASAVLGVASTTQTVAGGIQAIFNANCTGCHTGSTAGNLDLTDASIGNNTGVIGITSAGCAPKFRVVPGDPRRASSVLIDKIKATPGSAACFGTPMPMGSAQLSATDIQAIVDWVAGGAK